MSSRWRPRLGRSAERDLIVIVLWTRDRFGLEQARRYRSILLDAVSALADGPDLPGSRAAGEVSPGARILHAGRRGLRARHFLLYKAVDDGVIVIARVLHDAMDIERHRPTDDDWA